MLDKLERYVTPHPTSTLALFAASRSPPYGHKGSVQVNDGQKFDMALANKIFGAVLQRLAWAHGLWF